MIAPEDLVLVSVRGRTFYARVIGAERLGRFAIAPLDASGKRASTTCSTSNICER